MIELALIALQAMMGGPLRGRIKGTHGLGDIPGHVAQHLVESPYDPSFGYTYTGPPLTSAPGAGMFGHISGTTGGGAYNLKIQQ